MVGLADATIMTSLNALKPGKFSWDGESTVNKLEVQNSSLGNCAGVSKLQLVAMPCDEKQNFMCEKGTSTTTTSAPTTEYVIQPVLE